MKQFKKLITLAVSSALTLSLLPQISFADGELTVSAVGNAGKATLSWNDAGAAKYEIKRGDESVGEVDGNVFTFTDAPLGDSVYDYTVRALDGENNEMETDTAVVFVQDANTIAKQMFFDCGSGSTVKWEDKKAVHYDYDTSASRGNDWRGMNESDNAIKPGKSLNCEFLTDSQYIDFGFEAKPYDITDIKDNGFIGFLCYSDAANPDDIPSFAIGQNYSGWKWTGDISLKNRITPGKWSFVKINFSDMTGLDKFDLAHINHLRFTKKGSTAKHSLYIQGFGFYTSAGVVLNSVEEEKGNVTLKWHCDNPNVAYYKVYCNGESIAEPFAPATEYTYSIEDDSIFYNYYVEACAADGTVLSKTSEKQIVAYNSNYYEYLMAYKDNNLIGIGCGDDPNWTGPSYDNDIKAFGTRSLKLHVYGEGRIDKKKTNNIYMKFENTHDLSKDVDTLYFQMLIYCDAKEKTDYPQVAFCSSGYKWTKYMSLSNLKPNEWNFVRFKVSDIIEGVSDIKMNSINEIRFFIPGTISSEYNIYIQNLGFYNEIVPPTAEVVASGIDKNGNSYADVKFSKEMKESSLAGGFGLGDMNVTSVDYLADTQTARLTFDGQLVFPKEYTVTIADSVVCTFDRQVVEKEIKFTTANVQNSIYVNSCTVDKSAAASGSVKVNADITSIYSANGENMNIAMYTAVYDGEKLVGLSSVDIDNFALKSTKSDIEDTVTFDSPENAANIKAEVFFVDKTDFGRPLCAKLAY